MITDGLIISIVVTIISSIFGIIGAYLRKYWREQNHKWEQVYREIQNVANRMEKDFEYLRSRIEKLEERMVRLETDVKWIIKWIIKNGNNNDNISST